MTDAGFAFDQGSLQPLDLGTQPSRLTFQLRPVAEFTLLGHSPGIAGE
jgi:hypothetical protein